jgi:hypothetical protein
MGAVSRRIPHPAAPTKDAPELSGAPEPANALPQRPVRSQERFGFLPGVGALRGMMHGSTPSPL